jgi:hypothetical protein
MHMQSTRPYPIRMVAEYTQSRSRGLALTGVLFFLKAILLIPHFIVLYLLQIVMMVVAYVGYWVVLFTGRQPEGLHQFIAGTLQWYVRTAGWLLGLTDQYPPFTLEVDTPSLDASPSPLPVPPGGPAVPPPPPGN